MIEFLDEPYRATNTKDGFEILVHGFVLKDVVVAEVRVQELFALCIDEDGVFHEVRIDDRTIATDWRFDRRGNKGWHSLKAIDELE